MTELIRRTRTRRTMSTQQAQAQTVAGGALSDYAITQRRLSRPAELLDAVASLDTQTDERARKEIMEWINQVYAERQGGPLLGLFGRCFLGHPYIDHVMDTSGSILEHFTTSDSVPPGFTMARPLARSDAYLYIEVYADGEVVPIRMDGSAVC